jgi:ABC-type uncharacterized transport system YnjBCD permease subunit
MLEICDKQFKKISRMIVKIFDLKIIYTNLHITKFHKDWILKLKKARISISIVLILKQKTLPFLSVVRIQHMQVVNFTKQKIAPIQESRLTNFRFFLTLGNNEMSRILVPICDCFH